MINNDELMSSVLVQGHNRCSPPLIAITLILTLYNFTINQTSLCEYHNVIRRNDNIFSDYKRKYIFPCPYRGTDSNTHSFSSIFTFGFFEFVSVSA